MLTRRRRTSVTRRAPRVRSPTYGGCPQPMRRMPQHQIPVRTPTTVKSPVGTTAESAETLLRSATDRKSPIQIATGVGPPVSSALATRARRASETARKDKRAGGPVRANAQGAGESPLSTLEGLALRAVQELACIAGDWRLAQGHPPWPQRCQREASRLGPRGAVEPG